MFSENDIRQIKERGIGTAKVEEQISFFRSGFEPLPVIRPATAGDGIESYTPDQAQRLAQRYDSLVKGLKVSKFVPASGAATRMFKELYEFVGEGKPSKTIDSVLQNVKKFGFYEKLRESVKNFDDPKEVVTSIIDTGLGYGKKPKGLILFHSYPDGARTAIEEHIAEGAEYARSGDGTVKIHFTLSPEHSAEALELIREITPGYEKKYGVKYEISYSCQKPQTDTIAVDMNNEPFREENGSLLFRPAGHGALLSNLDEINADVIFIKNIDNVVPDRLIGDTILWKKVIAAVALEAQSTCFSYLHALAAGANENLIEEIKEFVEEELYYKLPSDFNSKTISERSKKLKAVLNRPIRVCAMVKNEGEPGGGPFWVRNGDGSESLQIAESSQIGEKDKEMMKNSTHFNPADLVCCVKDYRDDKFRLARYCDPKTGFISVKSKNGRELKAQELPGLWNGSMADWNTIFVEVPPSTFNPVKSIVDLLRPQHLQ